MLFVSGRCKLFEMFPSDAIIKSNPMLDNTILRKCVLCLIS